MESLFLCEYELLWIVNIRYEINTGSLPKYQCFSSILSLYLSFTILHICKSLATLNRLLSV